MDRITLRAVSDADVQFLFSIMNIDSILNVLNEVPTQLDDWMEAIQTWNQDNDEEDYIVCDGEMPIGWLGINGLSSTDKVAYLKLAVLLPCYHNKGIGQYAISCVADMLKQRNYSKLVLYTDEDNLKARACYGKCGFNSIKTLTEEMPNGKIVPRCIMELVF